MFATDSEEDVRNMAAFAHGSKLYVRIIMEEPPTADWPLSRKFGCHSDMAYELLVLAQSLGLEPFGISFHVGSQQRDIGQWDDALAKTKYLFSSLKEEKNINLKMINMGGGFPASYIQPTNDLSEYASEIYKYLTDDYGSEIPIIVLEPGRSLVGNSGILATEVVLVSRKSHSALNRWVYLDAGKFNGLIETLDESIKYPIVSGRDTSGCEEEDVILAGPTCDSMDILYQNHKYQLPLDLKTGEKLYVLSTGAYTASYASVFFNGFPPIKTYVMTEEVKK
jgi:ornithine decarboxylase